MPTKKKISQPDFNCVNGYIEQIWNKRNFEMLPAFVHDQFIDHSNPYPIVQNTRGLLLFLNKLDELITHVSTIQTLLSFEDMVIATIRIETIAKPNANVGQKKERFKVLRIFRMIDHRIAEHWEIILDFQKIDIAATPG